MARKFAIPVIYQSSIIARVKAYRSQTDPRRKDKSPLMLDMGNLRFKIARHFGFCYGVENAIEIAYRAVSENPGKRVFLLSEMIHNPRVNQDLETRGVRFLMSTGGERLIPFDQLSRDDIVIIPAFGTSIELFEELREKGIAAKSYNATCPFVEKVWKRAKDLGEKGYTIVIHGKHSHEETRATFSHARVAAPSIIVRDLEEARLLSQYIAGKKGFETFDDDFAGRYSSNFDPLTCLERIGVVNQTTMLASETQEISALLRETMVEVFGSGNISHHLADTRDTLCYATNENQEAVKALVESGGDVALIVGGYNSSNTSHLVELCERKVPSYYIKDASEIISNEAIRHLELESGKVKVTSPWLPPFPKGQRAMDFLITAGASCPDIVVDEVISRISGLLTPEIAIEEALGKLSVAA